ncbi:MAG TPA: cytochrome c peroxidase [Thermoanaerobaculia bacterium]|nr:cytochrome c peroxidase [Thermoanaerobaculia bacterium]
MHPSDKSKLLRVSAAAALGLCLAASAFAQIHPAPRQPVAPVSLDVRLARSLARAGFTGRIESTLEKRLGRPVDPDLASLGRDLFFDKILGLHGDNACAGCHSPTNGFGDTQSIAIGIQNNNLVGPGRTGPRNQRRTPMVINNAFFPKLMWNGRFRSPTGDPFDNSQGFVFPAPEGTSKFLPSDDEIRQLLVAQAHIPPTEQTEVAGFTGAGGPFDDGLGTPVPPPDASGFRNEPIRQAVLLRLNAAAAYRDAFARRFVPVAQGGRIDFKMVGQAIAEFEFSLTFANAPIDRFARGERSAMTDAQKRGALLFFGRAGCVRCHAVAGAANEMFSDFEMHAAGVPQLAPVYGAGTGDVAFAGPDGDEDYGLEDITSDPADRYAFRTSPLRNLALQPAFFHDGAFVRLEDAVRFHTDGAGLIDAYDPVAAGVAPDLCARVGPREALEDALDPLLREPLRLTDAEIDDLVTFLRDGLLDDRARPENLRALVPESVPSGRTMLEFQFE